MKASRLWIYRLVTKWLPETRCFGLKVALLRWCGAKIGRQVRINSSAVVLGDGNLEIGDDVWIGAGCRISPVGDATVKIGSNCDLAPEVMVLTGSHEIDPMGSHIGGKGIVASITIGNGCWLGAGSIVLPGVNLGCKTVVAAGAVVTNTFQDGLLLLAGVPATVKKRYCL